MTNNGRIYTTESLVVERVEKGEFFFAVTDSRGLTAEYSVEKPVVPYVKLTCNLANHKPDAGGNMIVSVFGKYFNSSFGATDNSLTVEYRYTPSGTPWQDSEEQWRSLEPVMTADGYTAQATLSGLDYQRAYTFQARAIDKLETVYSMEHTVRATPIFDWGERDFAIHGDLQVDGKILVDNTPVLNTSCVQTFYWQTNGGVCLQSVAEFMASCAQDCAFVTMIKGDAYPFVGMAVGMVCSGGKFGAATLYDYQNGAQSCRLFDGELCET